MVHRPSFFLIRSIVFPGLVAIHSSRFYAGRAQQHHFTERRGHYNYQATSRPASALVRPSWVRKAEGCGLQQLIGIIGKWESKIFGASSW